MAWQQRQAQRQQLPLLLEQSMALPVAQPVAAAVAAGVTPAMMMMMLRVVLLLSGWTRSPQERL
jgi:uncharacterized RDD family membrane protein YckC